jgi:MFS family permease
MMSVESIETSGRPRAAVPGLLPLTLIVLTGFLTVGLPLPAIPIRVHDALGFSPVTVGWIVGIQSLATVLTRGLGGRIADERGPRHAVLIGLPLASLAGVAYLASAYVADPRASLAVLIIGRITLGFAESLFLTACMAWGIARLGFARTGLVMAWQGIAMYGALGIGAPVGLALMDASGFAGLAIATIALPAIGILIALALPGVPAKASRRAPFHRVVGMIWRQGIVVTLSTAPFAAMAGFLALTYAANDWPGAGIALLGFAGGYVLVRLCLAHLPDRIGGARTATVSLAIEAAGQMLLWSAPSPAWALCGATLTGLGFSLIFPSMGVEAMRRVAPDNRGVAVGGFIAFFDLSIGLTAPLAGLLVAPYGFRSVFLAGALACLAGLAVLLVSRPAKGA